jgi:uncharacterized protein (TIGR03437 family)
VQLTASPDELRYRVGPTGDLRDVDVLFAGLAPSMIGIYQVSVRMPATLPPELALLQCGFPGDEAYAAGGYFFTYRN